MSVASIGQSVTLPPQLDLIDGAWEVPGVELGDTLDDPNTGAPLQARRGSTPLQVDRAIAAAGRVHESGAWRHRSPAERAAVLERIADALEPRFAEIARLDAINSGVPIGITTLFAEATAGSFRAAAARVADGFTPVELHDRAVPVLLHRLPWGPAAVISPWNAPTVEAAKKSAYALAAGCPVVLKPSSAAPSGASLLAEAIAEVTAAVGLPAGFFSLVHGSADVGTTLASDARIRALAFTGGRAGARRIAAAAAGDLKALHLEGGSNNPAIVRADADVDRTAEALVAGFTKLNGQWCESPGAVFVAASLHDRLVEAIVARAAVLRIGHSLDPETAVGPQSSRRQFETITRAVARLVSRGGRAIAGDLPGGPGYFIAPTVVIDADPADTVDEIFGPVLTLHRVRDDAEALRLANGRAGGLAGYVFSADVEAAMALGAEIAGGEIKVNGTSLFDMSGRSTQGFWTGSGIGGHGDAELLECFTGARIVGVDRPGLPM